MKATGSFEVVMTPGDVGPGDAGGAIGRFVLSKRFYGDLEATSEGQMLSVVTQTEGSAGYVAIEFVTGTLAGRPGSFALQHSGTLDRGDATLSLSVIPDSATEELVGLRGEMEITVEDGEHFYRFDHRLGAD